MTEMCKLPTIADAAQQLQDGRLTSEALVEACLHNIDAHEKDLGTFALLGRDEAIAAARAADLQLRQSAPAGALHGIPYALKDVIETAAMRTAAQSRSLETHVPTGDAFVAKKLRDAGGVFLGKSATWEFAHGGPAWDALNLPTRNPWNLKFDPSGSSSGTAAGIAAGFALGGLGTDTGGSIRGPAAACGITGLKPTYGLVSRFGVIPNSFSQDHVGPLAWTAHDAAILLQMIVGHDPRDAASVKVPAVDYLQYLERPLERLRIGVPRKWFEHEKVASDAVQDAFAIALRVLASLGAEIVEVELPALRDFDDVKKIIAAVELFTTHAQTLRNAPESLGQVFRVRVFAGGLMPAETYLNAHRQRRVLTRKLQSVWEHCDVLALPTGEPASELVPRPPEQFFQGSDYLSPFNVTGNPAIATRCGFDRHGLPLSIQFAGPLFDETTILNVAHQFEIHTEWRSIRPSFRQDPEAEVIHG